MGKLFTFNNGKTVYLLNVDANAELEDPYPKEFYENVKTYGRKEALKMLKEESKEESKDTSRSN